MLLVTNSWPQLAYVFYGQSLLRDMAGLFISAERGEVQQL